MGQDFSKTFQASLLFDQLGAALVRRQYSENER